MGKTLKEKIKELPIDRQKSLIDKNLSRTASTPYHSEIDTGNPRGKEIW